MNNPPSFPPMMQPNMANNAVGTESIIEFYKFSIANMTDNSNWQPKEGSDKMSEEFKKETENLLRNVDDKYFFSFLSKENCGSVRAINENSDTKFGYNNIETCDILSSELVDSQIHKLDIAEWIKKNKAFKQRNFEKLDIEFFYYLYLVFPARLTASEKDFNVIKKKYKELIEYYYDYKAIMEHYDSESFITNDKLHSAISKAEADINRTFRQFDKNDSSIKLENYNYGYLYKRIITKKDKVIIFGDIHGAYHTFFRHLMRLHVSKVIDITTLKLAPNHKIVFTGDLVDRGMFSTEILYLVFKMIEVNTYENVILLQGNHEGDNYGLKGIDSTLAADLIIRGFTGHYEKILNLFKKCACALILENKDTKERFWMSHGGFPYVPDNTDPSCKPFIDKQELPLDNDIIDGFVTGKSEISFYKVFDDKWKTQCMWNDFQTLPNKCTKGRASFSFKLTHEHVKEFCQKNDIKMIIRGHQDNINNFLIYTNINSNNFYLQKAQEKNINTYERAGHIVKYDGQMPFTKDNFKNTSSYKFNNNNQQKWYAKMKTNVGNDSNYDVNSTTNNAFEMYPVITNSTNTDYFRYFNTEGFIVLNFTGSFNNENIFTLNKQDFTTDAKFDKLFENIHKYKKCFSGGYNFNVNYNGNNKKVKKIANNIKLVKEKITQIAGNKNTLENRHRLYFAVKNLDFLKRDLYQNTL